MRRKNSHGKLIEKVTHGLFETEIRMEEGSGIFFCEYGGQRETGTLPEIRGWARMRLRESASLAWLPILVITIDDEDTRVNNLINCSNLSIRVERQWIAWDGKQWIECPWVVDPPGTYMCIGPANADREQPKMSEADLMAQRIAKSRPFHDGPKAPVIIFPLSADAGRGEKTFYIQFTEENFQTMRGILNKLRELRKGINKLMSTEKGWKQLAVVAESKLLTTGSK